MTMAWTLLLLAALLEIGWAIGLKLTAGFTRFWPSVWTLVAMVLSMALLSLAARTLPIGTAYAVWTGIGAAGTAVLGVYMFGEAATAARLTGIVLIIAGVALLKSAG
jgi:quaternary ammonium compound-resistance protein SugE